MLGPHFWSWVFLNHTQNLMLEALKTRVLIFGHWPWITQEIFDAFGAVVIFSNVAVVVIPRACFHPVVVLTAAFLPAMRPKTAPAISPVPLA
jgi:hypothetical protein